MIVIVIGYTDKNTRYEIDVNLLNSLDRNIRIGDLVHFIAANATRSMDCTAEEPGIFLYCLRQDTFWDEVDEEIDSRDNG